MPSSVELSLLLFCHVRGKRFLNRLPILKIINLYKKFYYDVVSTLVELCVVLSSPVLCGESNLKIAFQIENLVLYKIY